MFFTSLSGSHLQIGVGGYSFAVNNNGHLLYHPDLRPMVMIIVVFLWVAWFLYWVGWHGYAFQLFNFCICSSLVRSSSPTTTAWTWWRWSWWTILPMRSRGKIAPNFSWYQSPSFPTQSKSGAVLEEKQFLCFHWIFPAEASDGGPKDRQRKVKSEEAHGSHEESYCPRPNILPSGWWSWWWLGILWLLI